MLSVYADARQISFELTEGDFARAVPPILVSLAEIDRRAIQAWSNTWAGTHPSGIGGWNWGRLAHRYIHSPRNFHVALWVGDVLCGLAVGRVRRDHFALTLEYMARKQNAPNPLAGAVTDIVATAGVYYCKGLGIRLFELRNPAAGLVDRYRSAGFTIAYMRGASRYLAQPVI